MLSEEYLSFLRTVDNFSRVMRYYGVMPMRLAKSCLDAKVRYLTEHGYLSIIWPVTLNSYSGMSFGDQRGLVLTELGRRALLEATTHTAEPKAAAGPQPSLH